MVVGAEWIVHGVVVDFYVLLSTLSLRTRSIDKVHVSNNGAPVLICFNKGRVYLPAAAYFMTGLSQKCCAIRICTAHFAHPKRHI